MLVLNDSCIRNFSFGIVDYRISLVIVHSFQNFRLKPQRAILQRSQAIIKILIDHTRIEYFIPGISFCLCFCPIGFPVFLEGNSQTNFTSFQHFFHDGRIAALRNSLIAIVKIVVVVGKTQRQTFYDKSRKFSAVSSPLLLRISLHQFLIDIFSHQGQCLLFQILRLADRKSCNLFLNDLFRFSGCTNPPHFTECIHIKRHVIKFVLIHCHRRIHKIVKCGKTVYILPYFPVGSMKNMGTITMNVDAHNFFCINIPRNMIFLFQKQYLFPCLFHFMGKNCAKQAGSCNHIIIVHQIIPPTLILLCTF